MKRKHKAAGLRLASPPPAPADESVPAPSVEQQFDAPLAEACANVLAGAAEAPPDPAPVSVPAPPGTVRMLSDDEALRVLTANRTIIFAQEAARSAVAMHNARIVAAQKALDTLVEGYAVAHGISLDPAAGRWHFDVGTGSFTRLPDEEKAS